MTHPSRRAGAFRPLLAVLLAALLLAACGDDADDGSAAPAASGAFPVTITHKFGRTTIDGQPKRVVAVGYNDADFALALGTQPVGTRGPVDYPYADRPWARSAGDDEPQDIGKLQLSFERIAALRPDLILGVYSGMTRADYDKLSKIAPTVAQADAYADFGMPWPLQLRTTGQALGRPDAARTITDRVQRQIASARRAHPEFAGRSIAVASSGEGSGYYAFTAKDLRARFFTGLGFRIPAAVDRLAGKRFFAQVAAERLDLLDQDVLVVFGTKAKLESDPAFKRLRAVREGRVIYVPTGMPDLYGALNYNSPLSLPFQLQGFVPRLAAAIDGRPATTVEPIS